MKYSVPLLALSALVGASCVDSGCLDDLDCPLGTLCDFDGVCSNPDPLPGVPPYGPCRSVVECSVASHYCERIRTEWPDRPGMLSENAICTRSCDVQSDCGPTNSGFQGTCIARSCYETCVNDLDCGAGFACGLFLGRFRVCLPR